MIIAVTGITNIGQTFMDWSIHFLAGADKYWRADTKSDFFARWRPLSHDPLNSESSDGPESIDAASPDLGHAHKASRVSSSGVSVLR